VVDRRGRHHPPTESDAETLFVQLCRRARLPDPVRQHVLDDHTRLDFWFGPEAGGPLAVEIDGVSTHATRDALQYDLNRQNRIVGARLPVLRFTYDDVTRRRRVTARVVAQALGSEGAAASMLPTMDAPSARRAAS
jgi:very-short-patch-repair endonuclease